MTAPAKPVINLAHFHPVTVPASVATCPGCGAGLVVTDAWEWIEGDNAAPVVESIDLTCEILPRTERIRDHASAEAWIEAEGRVIEWLNATYTFVWEETNGRE